MEGEGGRVSSAASEGAGERGQRARGGGMNTYLRASDSGTTVGGGFSFSCSSA